MKNNYIVFDMDGTIADLYGVEGWLEMLRSEDTKPYAIANAMWDMEKLNTTLEALKQNGWKIAVVSWTSKNGSKEYNKATKAIKQQWIKKYLPAVQEFHAVKYGTLKHGVIRNKASYGILIDDDKDVRKSWKIGTTINPTTDNIIERLNELID